MSPIRQEHLDAILRQASETLQRLRTRLQDPLADRAAVAAATIDEARRAQDELLGPRATIVRAVDPATAVAILGDPRQLRAWSALLRAEAEAHRAMGAGSMAQELESRAEALEAHLPDSAR